MNFLKRVTKVDVERETLKRYLRNKGIEFNDSLIDPKINEPTDIRYNEANYQITIGDKEQIEEMRKVTSKGQIYTSVRNITNIAELLLSGALKKKANRSDSNTILLIEVSSTGNLSWDEIKGQFDNYALAHSELRGKWKEIYAVFAEKNIQF